MNPIKRINYLSIIALIFGIFLLMPAQKSQAQILELDQKVFGMDCAPCAKGVEVRMKRMDGVLSADVDLKNGEARLNFSENHTISLHQIHQSIIDGGFSPKEARIKVRGTLQQEEEQWQLITESGDVFLIEGIDSSELESTGKQKITIEGQVTENDDQESWLLVANQLQPNE